MHGQFVDVFRVEGRMPWLSMLVGLAFALGCGSETLVSADGGGSATSSTASSGGGSGGSSDIGGGLGSGGAIPDPCQSSSATVALDGDESPLAELEALWIAPSTFAEICFAYDVSDLPACNSTLYLSLSGLELGDNTATATLTLASDPPLTSEPDSFVVTVTEHVPLVVGTYEGTVGEGASAVAVTGSFAGCAFATD